MKKISTSLLAGGLLLCVGRQVNADILSNPFIHPGMHNHETYNGILRNLEHIQDIDNLIDAGSLSGVTAKTGSMTTAVIGDATRNILEIGTGTNPTQIHQSGINVNGQNLISTDANGVTKLGANSLNFQTVNGKENLWGTDASGNIIPLNVSNGSKLLINGRDVEQSIDNVGALSAALTGLPTVPLDSKFTCGVGTGAHGGNFAVSGGCATKVSERLTMNFAGSLIPTSQDYQGAGNDWSGRAGFLFKLGKIDKPTQISRVEKKEMKEKINSLNEANENLQAKVNSFEATNRALLSRLEKLEKFASLDNKDFARK